MDKEIERLLKQFNEPSPTQSYYLPRYPTNAPGSAEFLPPEQQEWIAVDNELEEAVANEMERVSRKVTLQTIVNALEEIKVAIEQLGDSDHE